jgi:hypothetical protein
MSVVEVLTHVLSSDVIQTTDVFVVAPSPHNNVTRGFSIVDHKANVTYVSRNTPTPLQALHAFQLGHSLYPIIIGSSYWLAEDGWMVRYGTAWCHALALRLVYPNGRFYICLGPTDPLWDSNDDRRFATVGLMRHGTPVHIGQGAYVVCLYRKWDFTFTVVPVHGDGNCQFRAIARALFDTEDRHREVRATVARDLREHPLLSEWRSAITGGESAIETWETYCDRMGTDGEWGDQTTLVAAARVYNVAFVVYNVNRETQFLQMDERSGATNSHTRLVYIEYTQDAHYNLRCLALTHKRCRSDNNNHTFPTKRVLPSSTGQIFNYGSGFHLFIPNSGQ